MCTLAALFSAIMVSSAWALPYHGEQARPVVLPSGHLADTHEVAAAKSAHLGALHGASASGHHHDVTGNSGAAVHSDIKYHGPQAVPKVLPDGHIADTHEVSAAKHAHLAAIAEAKSHGHHADDGSYHDGAHQVGAGATHGVYHGPLAKPVVLPSGHLADTHEVAAAKGAHLGALAQAHH